MDLPIFVDQSTVKACKLKEANMIINNLKAAAPVKENTPQKNNLERKHVSNHDVIRPNLKGPSMQSVGLNFAIDGQAN